MNAGPGLLVDGSMTRAGPAGTLHLLACGTHIVLDATGARWAPMARMGVRSRERRWLRTLSGALEGQRLRVDVESRGRTLFSVGFGCRVGCLSWLLGGAAVGRRARP